MIAFIPNFGKIRFKTQKIYLRKSEFVNRKVIYAIVSQFYEKSI